ncbi:type II toxin-antitoxin system PemK/MazF family toxin [Paraburkholderia caribensis]|uniref:type II toxin-antitoxin system PemK/MazF family toxin n=1 Tax=Paraburkholderia caribensis TaxID=75105 RepID=UPI001CABFF17|nr:type II toxin-antitoxin system PemK/MazF family toxin [Paraburkholderia caribensis]GJH34965.1 type II toxin-antitoxin system PemK/MazF family toxin [Paraburkholderia hospita]CAG9251349.1 Programmed cell death toxin MazF [Paraburkholderia caribensis]
MKNGVPEIGDVWWMRLEPVVGHEQGGSYARPVVVLSHYEHNGPAQRIVAVPCTSKIRGFSTEIPVSALPKPCVALIDQITTLDWVARRGEFREERIAQPELDAIRRSLKAFLMM